MATGSRPPKRPAVGSRNPTGRPRKVAGRRDAPPPEIDPGIEAETATQTESQTDLEVEAPDLPPPTPESKVEAPPPGDRDETDIVDSVEPPATLEEQDEPGFFRSALFTSTRTTVVLVAVLVVLLGLAAAEAWYVWVKDDEPVVSADRPVVTGEIARQAAVDAAAQSTADILTYGYQDFDQQIDDATTMMTDSFAQSYRDTAAGVRQQFIEQKTEQEVRVVGQSVVQASSEQVQALLFLDHYVIKAGKGTDVTPYRALVTMVHTDNGWLVDDIVTR